MHRQKSTRTAAVLQFTCSTLALAMAAAAAEAQVSPSVVDPGQVTRRLEREMRQPAPADLVIKREGDKSVVSGGSTEKAFTLNTVHIDGGSVYTHGELEALAADYTGQQVSFADLQTIANAMTAKYRADGYILSRVILPPQSINGGTVTFRAVEGYISDVQINGKLSGDGALVHEYADKIKADHPLKAATLERYLLLMDDLPGVTARSVLQASQEGTGATTLSVEITDKKVEGDVSFDNFGNKFLGPYQISAVAAVNSLLDDYDRNTVRGLITADFDEVKFAEYSYEHQLGSEGSRIGARASYTEVQPGASLEPFDIEGKTSLFEVNYLYPSLRSRKENLNFISRFRVQNSKNDILGFKQFDDHVRVITGGIDYDNVDNLDGINQFTFELNQGLDILNATDNGLGRSRVNADETFTSVTASLTRVQEIDENWSIFAATDGQYTEDSLLTSEQMALGGRRLGRGFDSSELLGDKGLTGSLELRYGDDVGQDGWLNSYQLYAFYDIGAVWLNAPVVGEESRESLASTGLGARFNLAADISGGVELALPLTRDVSSTGDQDPRIFFSLTKRF